MCERQQNVILFAPLDLMTYPIFDHSNVLHKNSSVSTYSAVYDNYSSSILN